MSAPHSQDRYLDLLSEHVATGLADADYAEMQNLLSADQEAASLGEGFETAAAALATAFADADATEPLPAALRHQCIGAAKAVQSVSVPTAPAVVESRPLRFTSERNAQPSSGLAKLGWLAAAACLLVAVGAWWPASSPTAGPASSDQLRIQLIAEANDLKQWDWAAWDPQFEGVTGDVVWSESAQEGYMTFSGLVPNDPSVEQYQLWVVDAARGTPLEVPPVDGGVFNVGSDGRVTIPIRTKLQARDVVAFAITREPPGGVVVSDRQRRVVIAQPPSSS